MRIEVKGRNLPVTDELRELVFRRFAKVDKQVSELAVLEIELCVERNPAIPDSQVAEAAFEWARWSGNEYQDQMAAEHDWIPVRNSARISEITVEGQPEGYRAVIDALAEARIGDVYSDNTQQIWVEVFDPKITQLLEENLDAATVAAEMDQQANGMLKG